MIQRRLSVWLILGTILMCQFGHSQAQKDSGFGDGKSNSNAFQNSQKGSELGESPSKNVANVGRARGNVRVETHSSTSVGDDDSASGPPPAQNASPPAARPFGATAGGGISGLGSDRNANRGPSVDRNPNAASAIQPKQESNPPSAGDQQEQTQDGPPQPQVQFRPQPQGQAPAQIPHARPSTAGGARGGAKPNIGEEASGVALTGLASGDGGEESAISPIQNTAAGTGHNSSGGRAGSSAGSNKGKAAKVRPGSGGGSIAGVGSGASGLDSGDGIIGDAPTTSPRPKVASGLVPSASVPEDNSDSAHGPPAIAPNASTFSGGRAPADAALKAGAAGGPHLSARSPGASPQPQAPLEPIGKGSAQVPAASGSPSGDPSGRSAEAGGEEGASSALIKAVNDEYVDVVKNLTDAGILTEADYESKPVSDLFAILLEKLINANPGASEEDQHRLVHQAGIEFVEVFKANAANIKNVSEIVRLVNEQLQTAPIVLNEGHADAGLIRAAVSPLDTTTPISNPLDATAAVRFGSPGRTSNKAGPKASSDASPSPNVTLSSNNSTKPVPVLGQHPSSNTAGASRRPVSGAAGIQPDGPTFPGPPGGEADLNQNSSTPSSALEGDDRGNKQGSGLPFAGSGQSRASPVSGTGLQSGSSASRVGGFNSVGGQFTSQDSLNGTNGTKFENGTNLQGSFGETVSTTQEPTQEGPAVIPGNARFPFPAHAPSTLRPPLRFFTTSSTTSTTEGEQPSFGRGGLGSESQSPFVVTAAPPSFIPFGRSPSPTPGNGRVVVGGSSGSGDSSSETLGGDFPVPPIWEYSSESTQAPVIIGAGGVEFPKPVTTLRPAEGGVLGVSDNSTSSSTVSSPTLLGHEPILADNTTRSPLVTTTSDEVSAPFTHDVHDIFGGSLSNTASSAPISGLIGNVTVAPKNNATTGNITDGEFLVFGSGLQSNSNNPTSRPSQNTTESGEAFVTESGEVNETNIDGSGHVRTLSGITPISPVVVPGEESVLPGSNITANDTNVTTTLSPLFPGLGPDLSTSATHLQSESTAFGIESTQSSKIGELNQTSSSSNVPTTSSGFAIGQGNGTIELITTGASTTNERFGNESSIYTSSDIPSVTVSGVQSSTPAESESGSGSGSGDLVNRTMDHGVSLPTRPSEGNATAAPGSEGETSTSSSGATSGSGSSPMLIWSFRITDPQTAWDSELLNKESFQYKELYSSLTTDLKTLFKTLEPTRFVDVTIKRFSKGSVIVDGQTELSERVDSTQLLDNFVKLVGEHKNTIGGRQVDPSSITFDRHQYAPQASSGNAASAGGGTPNWVIALVVAIILLALIIIAAAVVIKRRKRQSNRDSYMVDEETMNGAGAKPWQARNANQQAQGQQRSAALTNGRDQYAGVNMYEMKEPAAPNAHMNYGYQPDRPANGHGAHGRSVTEIHINAETNVDNEASSKH